MKNEQSKSSEKRRSILMSGLALNLALLAFWLFTHYVVVNSLLLALCSLWFTATMMVNIIGLVAFIATFLPERKPEGAPH